VPGVPGVPEAPIGPTEPVGPGVPITPGVPARPVIMPLLIIYNQVPGFHPVPVLNAGFIKDVLPTVELLIKKTSNGNNGLRALV
jgi:hypothetical protein